MLSIILLIIFSPAILIAGFVSLAIMFGILYTIIIVLIELIKEIIKQVRKWLKQEDQKNIQK